MKAMIMFCTSSFSLGCDALDYYSVQTEIIRDLVCVFAPVFQISEELDKVKQEMEEKGSSMSDGGETQD